MLFDSSVRLVIDLFGVTVNVEQDPCRQLFWNLVLTVVWSLWSVVLLVILIGSFFMIVIWSWPHGQDICHVFHQYEVTIGPYKQCKQKGGHRDFNSWSCHAVSRTIRDMLNNAISHQWHKLRETSNNQCFF